MSAMPDDRPSSPSMKLMLLIMPDDPEDREPDRERAVEADDARRRTGC